MNREKQCLFCLENLTDQDTDFHKKCSRKFFGSTVAPILPYSIGDMHDLAKKIVQRSIAVTGVQPKLSLTFEKNVVENIFRLTLVGVLGDYILKPPNKNFKELPENEHLTMRLAQTFGIQTVPFSFIRLQSGELAYLTKRIDRTPNGKLAMEDFCQLSERLSEYKYRGSVEQLAKVIRKYTTNPGLDVVNLFEIVLASFLCGNADNHLKNYSLLTTTNNEIRLAPAYDLVATKLLIPQDKEESALTINAKKARLTSKDFQAFAGNAGIPETVFFRTLSKFQKKLPNAFSEINRSLMSPNMKTAYTSLLAERAKRIGLV